MRPILCLLVTLAAVMASPAAARAGTVEIVEEWVEVGSGDGASRFISPAQAAADESLAAYGPFHVIDEKRAAMIGATDSRSPDHFVAMLRDFPRLTALDMIECPGTYDDRANLEAGRLIRAAGLVTRVPDGGSVRSGAVELFVAGARREAADDAEFAVHAWRDDEGLEANDHASTSPEHRKYLAYYREMGMSAPQAEAFYAMTNSVPHAQALWLTGAQMRDWVAVELSLPTLAYLDLEPSLN